MCNIPGFRLKSTRRLAEAADFAKLFFSFSQVKSPRFRKVVCQKFQIAQKICTFVYKTKYRCVRKVYRIDANAKV